MQLGVGTVLLALCLLAALGLRQWLGKTRLERVIFESDTPAGKNFDLALLIAIGSSVLLVALESDRQLDSLFGPWFSGAEWVFSTLFSLEYLLRLLCSRTPLRYARSFFGVVDLVSSIPPLLTIGIPVGQAFLIIRVLRLLRVFRILKLGAYLKEADQLRQALVQSRRKITVFLLTIVALVVLIGTAMYVIEGPESGFRSIPIGIYWAVVTITTVGYGDVAPVTPLGRCVASLVMLLGYSIIAVPTGIVGAKFQQMQRLQPTLVQRSCGQCHTTSHRAEAQFCDHCGAGLPS
ncbi:MAG: ion transporter [Vulcanococcus sp.]|jgi:voltage-gated potassium channel|uniref:ion transporter n=1 Tax=unclassified Vulcanococcus TaxID=2766969 RepID=UPI000D7AFB4F|nr:ion transporter [Vulcanococcus sp. DEBay_Sum22DG08_74]NCV93186.1 ion transporter [Synechococcaceae bacterium WB7_3xG_012]PWL22308.1 MAG: ion transporter [Synechococcus sp. XM-24]